ncbi:unnamed protein product [Rotaria sp. Silwood1]|nr:unnamed protein product [Rotaria sp. Silwood1]CAF1556608.1 unnamed protein product [Rotaria sp. Silwood1]CAF3620302.1 unnamed protein product [Rotaria sp. Silwood1]
MSRFLDANEEPSQTLLPIAGYEKEELVSLEEAVRPITTLLYDLDTKVYIAKRNSQKPADGLTCNQSAAINLYTIEWEEPHDSLYTILNRTLRSSERKALKPWFSYLKLFLTALYKLPSTKGVIWRGIRDDVYDQYNIDQVWWGVSSCTATMQVMEQFVGRSGVRTLFTIECISGKAIGAHSFYKNENEIVLMPGTYLRVVAKWSPNENLYMIHLREENPPCQFIAPPFIKESSQTNETSFNKDLEHSEYRPRSINFAGRKLTDTDVEKIVKDKTIKNHCTQLNLSGNNLTWYGCWAIGNALRTNTALIQLDLTSNKITEKGIQYLTDALRSNKIQRLTRLGLGGNEITDNGVHYLSEALFINRKLVQLDLESNRISEKGAQRLVDALKTNKNLTELNLWCNPLMDEGIQYLANVLADSRTITKLGLERSEITEQGTKHLTCALYSNTSLTQLSLWGNHIGDKGAQYLAESLFINKTLTHLDLGKNELTHDGAQKLADALRSNRVQEIIF